MITSSVFVNAHELSTTSFHLRLNSSAPTLALGRVYHDISVELPEFSKASVRCPDYTLLVA